MNVTNIWNRIKGILAIVGAYLLGGVYFTEAEAKRFVRWSILFLATSMACMVLGVWAQKSWVILIGTVMAAMTVLTSRWILEQSVRMADALAKTADAAAQAAVKTANAATAIAQPPLPPIPVPGAVFGPITSAVRTELEQSFLPTFGTFALLLAFAGSYAVLKGPAFITPAMVLSWIAFAFTLGLLIRALGWRTLWMEKILLVVLIFVMIANQIFPTQAKAILGRLESWTLSLSQDMNNRPDGGLVAVPYDSPLFLRQKSSWFSGQQLTATSWPTGYTGLEAKVLTTVTDAATGQDLYEVVFPSSPATPGLFIGGKHYLVPVNFTQQTAAILATKAAPPTAPVPVPWTETHTFTGTKEMWFSQRVLDAGDQYDLTVTGTVYAIPRQPGDSPLSPGTSNRHAIARGVIGIEGMPGAIITVSGI